MKTALVFMSFIIPVLTLLRVFKYSLCGVSGMFTRDGGVHKFWGCASRGDLKNDWKVQVIPQQAIKAIPVLSTRKVVIRRQKLGWHFLLRR
jgi:hypothetical protein